ncbi:hypothetical protein AXFE_15020 [Acidithrix ferrooxidans]|uniref:Uncharacterized protein n=1 Tax=Acidithrix ferrooxidans TaxID=1280514 RepID=A0A0D8HIJ9_9ACTN|nr:hypothetical protein AXFE_15020 [Acidithrix ferrooxidans]
MANWIQLCNGNKTYSSVGDISPTGFPQVSYVEGCIVERTYVLRLVTMVSNPNLGN